MLVLSVFAVIFVGSALILTARTCSSHWSRGAAKPFSLESQRSNASDANGWSHAVSRRVAGVIRHSAMRSQAAREIHWVYSRRLYRVSQSAKQCIVWLGGALKCHHLVMVRAAMSSAKSAWWCSMTGRVLRGIHSIDDLLCKWARNPWEDEYYETTETSSVSDMTSNSAEMRHDPVIKLCDYEQ